VRAPFDVVGIGENSVDLVVQLPQPAWFGPGAKLDVAPPARRVGGQVVTTLATCAAFGLRTAYVGAWGDDDAGTQVRRELEQRGIDVSAAHTRHGPTRSAVILVEPHGERLVLASKDATLRLRGDDVPRDLLASARVVHVDGSDPEASLHAARAARAAGVVVTCDIDGSEADPAALVDAATHPILAESVPGLLTGRSDPDGALRALAARHTGPVCVTRGSRGAAVVWHGRLHHHPAWTVDVLDTTGAGDVFRGAFIAALLSGAEPDVILRVATAAAALSCTRVGALAGVPSGADVETLLLQEQTPQGRHD
jgi:sulfofructose kinase